MTVASGQFDDALDDEDSLFVTSMLKRLDMEEKQKRFVATTVTIDGSTTTTTTMTTNRTTKDDDGNGNANAAPISATTTPASDERPEEEEENYDEEYDDYYEDDDYYDDYDHHVDAEGGGGGGGGGSVVLTSGSADRSHHNAAAAFVESSSRVNLDDVRTRASRRRANHTGRDDRATTEGVLDPRTRLILFKLLSSGFLSGVDGCLSTGKEANVYYAKGASPKNEEYALKVYKTSVLVFRDRDRYVSGEHRWRRGYCRSNPRKMVRVWAEKETRNYRRLHRAGLPCPEPVALKGHVLLMRFLGRNGWPSPRLKDAALSPSRRREAYAQTLRIMRRMYAECRLVHGDLSEYNLLWHDKRVYVIDVSQSVETDHPRALDFLRQDCRNVNDFFRRGDDGLDVPTTRALFAYVVDENVDRDEDAALAALTAEAAREAASLRSATESERRERAHRNEVDEAVFAGQFLPRSLNQVVEDYDVQRRVEEDGADADEADVEYARAVASMTARGDADDATTTRTSTPRATTVAARGEEGRLVEKAAVTENDAGGDRDDDAAEEEEGDDDESEDSDSDEERERYVKVPLTPEQQRAAKEARREERKANKKAVKEERSEKRKTKIKKKDKRKAIKKTKGNKKNK